jgi:GT2 family glycosyltransferase
VKEEPFFSIIVPTYNRQGQLHSCLRSISRLKYPSDRFEVIVVNDGGGQDVPGTLSLCQNLDVKLIDQEHAGPAAARNTGAAYAKGEFLAFTDDDCNPSPQWLAALSQSLSKSPGHLVGGRTVNALPRNVFSTASQLLNSYVYRYYNADLVAPRFFASNNMAVPSERFRSIGGFDSACMLAAAEDRELCDRWRYYGYRMAYAPEAVVRHRHRLTLRSFWRQHFRYGRGAHQFHKVRYLRDRQPIRLEPPSFYVNLLAYPFTRRECQRPAAVSGLLILSQAASVTGFFSEMLNPTSRNPRKM